MTSEWGRDSNFHLAGKRRTGSVTAILMILSLALGVAGGYGAFRFTQADISVDASGAAQTDELEAKIARQAAELDAMAQNLAAVSDKAEMTATTISTAENLTRERDALVAENETLKQNVAALKAGIDAITQDANVAEARVADELARLQNEVVPDLTTERDQLKRKTLMMLADQENLKARAKAAADSQAADAKRIAELESRVANTEGELAASQEVLNRLSLERRSSEAPQIVAEDVEVDAAKLQDPLENSALDARDPDAVAAALRTAPGLETLSDTDRQKLTDTLVAGECVTTALKSVFDRVPILTLRNLIRDLNSDC